MSMIQSQRLTVIGLGFVCNLQRSDQIQNLYHQQSIGPSALNGTLKIHSFSKMERFGENVTKPFNFAFLRAESMYKERF